MHLLIFFHFVSTQRRRVLQQARAQKLPPKKMKFLFTKSIAFEEKYGNASDVAEIKQEAEKYVSNYGKIFDKE